MSGPRVVVPYAPGKLHPITRAVLESYCLPWLTFCETSGRFGYSTLLEALWHECRTVVIVEQDVIPWPGAIEELHGCPGVWCTCSYPYAGQGPGIYHMLGCSKISDRLMAATPNLWSEPVPWNECDVHLLRAANAQGQEPHPHRPPVVHLNPREIGAAA